jgi:hypothetical protein
MPDGFQPLNYRHYPSEYYKKQTKTRFKVDELPCNLYNNCYATYYFKENFMIETELNNLEYLSGVFKGLSTDKKDRVLNAARSLLKIQDDNNHSAASSKTISHSKKGGKLYGQEGNL